ncbi:hypothetical protein [Confluentibacter citreus]|uniref:hypothetical protein n=1 Tax=Confluentibacter citreus TaxID=2007307 RepID=UPI0012FD206C|nr:hypothetical protein [Confluentibacter citreus]
MDDVKEIDFLNTIKQYLFSFNFFMLGIVIYYNSSIRLKRILFKTSFTESLFFKFNYPHFLVILSKLLLLFIIILYFITYGLDIFTRSSYLSPDHSGALQLLIKILSLINVILLGVTYISHRKLSNLFFWVLMIFSFGTGSRITVLYLLIYFILIFQAKGNNLFNKLSFGFNMLFSFVIFSLLITFRSFDEHGILPYFSGLFNNENSVLSNFQRNFMFNIYYTFIFGVFVTIQTLKEAIPDWNIILVSLNPLPGTIAGFYKYVPDLMINPFAPFTSHGQVFVMGKTFSAFFYLSIGVIFADIDYRVRRLFDNKKRIFAFVLVFISVLYVIYSFEYLLRSAVRYLYYLYSLLFLTWIFKEAYKNLPKKRK